MGLYAFGADSQFPQGDRGGPADEQVEPREGERVLESPSAGGRRTALPVGVERGLEPAREFGVLDDDADLPIVRRRPEAPVHAGHEHLTAVHDDPLVVQPFDGAARLEQTGLQRESLILRRAIDPGDDVIVRPRIGFDGRPTTIDEDPDDDAPRCGFERGREEGIRRIAPGLLDIERLDGEPVAGRPEQVEDPVGIQRGIRTDNEAGPSIPRTLSPGPGRLRWRRR